MSRVLLLWLCWSLQPAWSATPGAPSILAAQLLANPDYTWQHTDSAHFQIHYIKDSYAAQHLPMMKRHLDDAFVHALSLLDTTAYVHRIDVFLLDSRADMLRLMGTKAAGLANAGEHTVLLVANPMWRAFDRHEVFHILHENVWGAGAEPYSWFREGLAIHADGFCGCYTVEELAAYLLREGKLVGLRELMLHADQYDEMVRGITAGGFMAFLYAHYSVTQIRQFWTGGVESYERVFGVSLETMEAQYQEYLREISIDGVTIDWLTLTEKGCG